MNIEPNQKTSTGIQENLSCLLCYLFTWITGLIFFLVEKENKTVRYHAVQSIMIGVCLIVVNIVTSILRIVPILGGIIAVVVGLATFALYIYLIVTAYRGTMIKFPIISEQAEKFVNK